MTLTLTLRCSRFSLALLTLLGACFHLSVDKSAQLADAGADDAESDAGADAGVDAGADAPTGPLHHACQMPLGDSQLKSGFHATASATAALGEFAKLDCATVGGLLSSCDEPRACRYAGSCLRVGPGQKGYCVTAASDAWTPLSYRAGECHAEVHADEKAALCCAHVPGVDCRVYPFEAHTGGPGMHCGSSSDCESGLVCRGVRASDGSGNAEPLGVCQCPEADGKSQSDPGSCAQPTSGIWGNGSVGLQGECLDQQTGFVDETISRASANTLALGKTAPLVTLAPSGAPAFLHLYDDHGTGSSLFLIARSEDMPKVSPATKVVDYAFGYALYDLGISGVSSARAAFAPDGSLHIASFDELDLTMRSTDGNTIWHQELPTDEGAPVADFIIDAAGRFHLLITYVQGEPDHEDDLLQQLVKTGDTWTPGHGNVVDCDYGAELVLREDVLPPLALCRGSVLNLVDLDTNTVLWKTAEPLMSTAVAGEAVTVATTSKAAAIDLFTLDHPDVLQTGSAPEQVFRAEPRTEHYAGQIPGSMLSDAHGNITIAHDTPNGMAITQKLNDKWSTEAVTSSGGNPILVRDSAGNPELYYFADDDYDGVTDHIHRLRKGTCEPSHADEQTSVDIELGVRQRVPR